MKTPKRLLFLIMACCVFSTNVFAASLPDMDAPSREIISVKDIPSSSEPQPEETDTDMEETETPVQPEPPQGDPTTQPSEDVQDIPDVYLPLDDAELISVFVPISFPLEMDASGKISAMSDVCITNNSQSAIRVSGCDIKYKNGWSYSESPHEDPIGTDSMLFFLNGAVCDETGSVDTSLWSENMIRQGGKLHLMYGAEVSAQAEAVHDKEIASVVFTIELVEDDTPAQDAPTQPEEPTQPPEPMEPSVPPVDETDAPEETAPATDGPVVTEEPGEEPSMPPEPTDTAPPPEETGPVTSEKPAPMPNEDPPPEQAELPVANE